MSGRRNSRSTGEDRKHAGIGRRDFVVGVGGFTLGSVVGGAVNGAMSGISQAVATRLMTSAPTLATSAATIVASTSAIIMAAPSLTKGEPCNPVTIYFGAGDDRYGP